MLPCQDLIYLVMTPSDSPTPTAQTDPLHLLLGRIRPNAAMHIGADAQYDGRRCPEEREERMWQCLYRMLLAHAGLEHVSRA